MLKFLNGEHDFKCIEKVLDKRKDASENVENKELIKK